MGTFNHLTAEGVFIEHQGFPAVFVDAAACSKSQVEAIERMGREIGRPKPVEAGLSRSSAPTDPQPSQGTVQAAVSKQSVELKCSSGPVAQMGYVFKLGHLKSSGLVLVRQYIRDMEGLPLGKTRFNFSFDREGAMQSWARVQDRPIPGNKSILLLSRPEHASQDQFLDAAKETAAVEIAMS